MAAEIAEQPAVLDRILTEGRTAVRAVAGSVARHAPRFVLVAGRGSSDHAALYAKYLVEIRLGLPAGLVSPSTTTLYGARPDLRGVLVLAVSQSGGSPDLVESTRVARECGALTVAVTNDAASPLARASALHLALLAGPERAVPATKSYTAQLLTLWLLVDGWRGGDGADAGALPALAAAALARTAEVAAVADRYRFAERLVVTGRGYAHATAREAALKVMETSFLSTHAWSGADLLHGPLAMVDERTPCLVVAPEGAGGAALGPVLARLRERGADLTVVGARAAVESAGGGVVLPGPVPESLSPVLEVLPLQLLAHRLALARGHDPDTPRALGKVTRTR
ncbi:MAG: SIS domain-containing protein [Actinobacteria bacterium]|nr:SIS domain-containing protein [Actinomycetota bacterium]